MPHIKTYKRSWETDEIMLRLHILPKLGAKYLDEVKRQDIVDIMSQLRNEKAYKPATVNRALILVRYIYNCALKWEVEGVERNPSSGITPLRANNMRERYLKDDEPERLFKALSESTNKLLPHIVSMLLLTGARRGEVLNAKWEDLDFDTQLWRIEFNKTGKPRYVPISPALEQVLSHVEKVPGNPYIFPNPQTGKPFTNIFHSWETARKKAGMPDLRIHDLRHSFASFLINQGRQLYEVQRILGHTQIKTTQRYAHLSKDSLQEAANTAANSMPWLTDQLADNKGGGIEVVEDSEVVPDMALLSHDSSDVDDALDE